MCEAAAKEQGVAWPARMLVAAVFMATSAEDSAESTENAGPQKPRMNESLAAAREFACPFSAVRADESAPHTRERMTSATAESCPPMPRTTPVLEPCKTSRRRRGSSKHGSALYISSSSRRCCGSIAAASEKETPKYSLSNRCAPAMKPPQESASNRELSPEVSSEDVSHRRVGTRFTQHAPAQRAFTDPSFLSATPGHAPEKSAIRRTVDDGLKLGARGPGLIGPHSGVWGEASAKPPPPSIKIPTASSLREAFRHWPCITKRNP